MFQDREFSSYFKLLHPAELGGRQLPETGGRILILGFQTRMSPEGDLNPPRRQN